MKLAVRNNGQVQFSERLSDNNDQDNKLQKDTYVCTSTNSNTSNSDINDEKINHDENNNNISDPHKSITNNDQNNNDTLSNNSNDNERHSRKCIDTAIVVNENNSNSDSNNTERMKADRNDDKNDESDDQYNGNGKGSIDKNSFDKLYETVRNQWLPGQRMKTLTNEFLNTGDHFTTSQVKQLIQLVTEEDNRLKLTKSSYHCITDPENFNQLDDILRFKTSRDELDDFAKNDRQ